MQATNNPPTKIPILIALTRALFFLNAAVWIFFLILFLSDQVTPGDPVSSLVVPILMGGNACAMLACGIGLGKRNRFFYYMSLLVIGINLLLALTDQVGLFDYITLLLDLVILALLVASYRGFSPSAKPLDPSNPTL